MGAPIQNRLGRDCVSDGILRQSENECVTDGQLENSAARHLQIKKEGQKAVDAGVLPSSVAIELGSSSINFDDTGIYTGSIKDWNYYIGTFITSIGEHMHDSTCIPANWFKDNFLVDSEMLVCVHIDRNFSVVTWNTRGALGSLVFQNPVQAKIKWDALDFVLESANVSFFQEVHHQCEDIERLQGKHASLYRIFHSAGITRNEGGLMIAIQLKWLVGMIGLWCVNIFPGRSMIVFVAFEDCLWAFANLHIPPQWAHVEKCNLIRETMNCIPQQPNCFCWFGGDLNFGEECGVFSPDTTISGNRARDRVQAFFEDTYLDYTELVQEEATHRSSTSISRNDRLFCNFYTSALLDLKLCISLLWRMTNRFGGASDHFPLKVACIVSETVFAPSLPKWVPRHPKFQELVLEEWNSIYHLDEDPGNEVLRAKDVFASCANTLRKCVEAGQAVDLQQKIYWTLVCFRHCCNPESEFCRRAMLAYPDLNGLRIADCNHFDTSKLHQHLADLNIEYANNILENESVNELPIQKKRALSMWVTKWARSRKKFRTLTIVGMDGFPRGTFEEGAVCLAKHCETTFKHVDVNLELAERKLRDFIVPLQIVEPSIEEELEYYRSKLEVVKDSGAGPDNLTYSYWSLAPEPICDLPFGVYQELKRGGSPYFGMNFSKLVVIPKEEPENPAEETQSIRVDNVRPLSLSNVDSKLVASVAIKPVTDAASSQLHCDQRGGLSGRQLDDDILDIEAKAIQFALQKACLAALFCFDIKTAFPALSRAYIFWILTAMGVCNARMGVTMALYLDNLHVIILNGRPSNEWINILAGCKQGCPMSMTIFTIAIDPFVRLMCYQLDRCKSISRAFCDDLAVCAHNYRRALRIMAGVFLLLQHCAALFLNALKTQVWLIGCVDEQEFRDWIEMNVPMFNGICIKQCVKYLGNQIGPGAEEIEWDKPCNGFLEVTKFVSGLGLGLNSGLRFYNMLAHSKLAWLASFTQPNEKVIESERWGLQKVCRAPWQTFPTKLLQNLRCEGIPIEAQSIVITSLAARTRNALQTSKCFSGLCTFVDQELQADPRYLDFPLRSWMERSHLFRLRDAVKETRSIIGSSKLDELVEKGVSCQKALYKLLHEKMTIAELGPTIERRLTMKLNLERGHIPCRMMADNIKLCFKRLKPSVGFAVLRIFCGALCTSSAFGEESKCRWGCTHNDRLTEIIGCKAVQTDIAASIGFQIVPKCATECFFFIGTQLPGLSCEEWILCRSIYLYILVSYYNHRKVNPECCRRYPEAICKSLAAHCNASRKLLNTLRLFRPRRASDFE